MVVSGKLVTCSITENEIGTDYVGFNYKCKKTGREIINLDRENSVRHLIERGKMAFIENGVLRARRNQRDKAYAALITGGVAFEWVAADQVKIVRAFDINRTDSRPESVVHSARLKAQRLGDRRRAGMLTKIQRQVAECERSTIEGRDAVLASALEILAELEQRDASLSGIVGELGALMREDEASHKQWEEKVAEERKLRQWEGKGLRREL